MYTSSNGSGYSSAALAITSHTPLYSVTKWLFGGALMHFHWCTQLRIIIIVYYFRLWILKSYIIRRNHLDMVVGVGFLLMLAQGVFCSQIHVFRRFDIIVMSQSVLIFDAEISVILFSPLLLCTLSIYSKNYFRCCHKTSMEQFYIYRSNTASMPFVEQSKSIKFCLICTGELVPYGRCSRKCENCSRCSWEKSHFADVSFGVFFCSSTDSFHFSEPDFYKIRCTSLHQNINIYFYSFFPTKLKTKMCVCVCSIRKLDHFNEHCHLNYINSFVAFLASLQFRSCSMSNTMKL